jgi:hypothetical protein
MCKQVPVYIARPLNNLENILAKSILEFVQNLVSIRPNPNMGCGLRSIKSTFLPVKDMSGNPESESKWFRE